MATTATAAAKAGLTRAQYSGLDFDTVLDDVLARAQAKYSANFNNFALSDLGVVLIESFSVAFDQLAFYLDRRATDTYLETVRTSRNAAYLARQVGYKVNPAVSSSVDETISLGTVRALNGVSVCAYSSAIHPSPRPQSARPSESTSSVAILRSRS